MNIAILLRGHMRCWKMVYPNFKQQIIDRFPNSDIFIHTWADEAYWTPTEGAKGFHEQSPLLDYNAVKSVYKPLRLVVEDTEGFLPFFQERVKVFTNYYHRPKNICSMFYKISEVVHMLERHIHLTGKPYDLVVCMRPDMYLHSAIPDINPEIFYSLWSRNHVGKGLGDQLYISNLDNMIKFSKIGINLERLYVKHGLLCPHELSEIWIKELGFRHQELMIGKSLQHTPSGEYIPWNHSPK